MARYGKVWPGNCPAILAGDMGDTFFMIYEGQALLVVRDDQGEDMILGYFWVAHHWPKIHTTGQRSPPLHWQEHPCGVLSAGDYIGGGSVLSTMRLLFTSLHEFFLNPVAY